MDGSKTGYKKSLNFSRNHRLRKREPLSALINILFVGDVLGAAGLSILTNLLKSFLEKYHIDLCVANGENLSAGKGITEEDAKKLFALGVHVITTGNHLWEKYQIRSYIGQEKNLLRPLNYPRENPGYGYVVYDLGAKGRVGIINLQGRSFMYPIDCPFKTADSAISRIQQETKVILVDMHAEATAEKMSLGWYLDGRVTAVVGTHTHIPTADARILPNGTAYITDVGMTGPYDSVIGMKKEQAIKRAIYQTPFKYEQGTDSVKFCAVFISANSGTGKAEKIERIVFPEF